MLLELLKPLAVVAVLGAAGCGGILDYSCPSNQLFPLDISPDALPLETPTTVTVRFIAPEPVFEPPYDSEESLEDLGFSLAQVEETHERLHWNEAADLADPAFSGVEILDGWTFRFTVELPTSFGPGPYVLRVKSAEPMGSCRGGAAMQEISGAHSVGHQR